MTIYPWCLPNAVIDSQLLLQEISVHGYDYFALYAVVGRAGVVLV